MLRSGAAHAEPARSDACLMSADSTTRLYESNKREGQRAGRDVGILARNLRDAGHPVRKNRMYLRFANAAVKIEA